MSHRGQQGFGCNGPKAHMHLQVAAVSESGRGYVWECRADAAGRVEATLRARIAVGSRCGCVVEV